ncbi:Na+/H+ antiporter NhaC family protein [Helicobacter pametensis]|uniref:Na+/H+ antiporter NhaC family protein n=1 Tax=Helicobacter pametensis TaxID=95149 RepID=UPI0004841B49|nr:Na+/H+ antiporter NhaC family protein [Helicobacter pametensis]
MDSSLLWGLLVPFSTILGILITRNVFISLILGLLCGGIVVNFGTPLEIPMYFLEKFRSIFWGSSGFAWGKLYIIGFLLCLGILGEFFLHSGGIGAMGGWIRSKLKTPKSSEFALFVFGIIIFIDGCFNAVILGQIARSVGEIYRLSKERLAYIVDSTSSPVCVLVPFSSWGAYILGILQSNLGAHQNASLVLFESIGFNFYAWLTLICVGMTIVWQVDAPTQRLMIAEPKEDPLPKQTHQKSMFFIFVPFLVLFVSVFLFVFFDGYQKAQQLDLMQIFAHSDINRSLFWGGMIGVVISVILAYKRLDRDWMKSVVWKGGMTMSSAIGVLILAWALAPILKDDLKLGILLSELFAHSSFFDSPLLLPMLLFGISMLISFSTGTSWGCFAIMLPIGIELALYSGGNVALAVASVLGGSLYGDHTSPISDTTILSSASVKCSLHNHFITQMFFAGICALCSFVGLFVYAESESLALSFGVAVMILLLCLWVVKKRGRVANIRIDS